MIKYLRLNIEIKDGEELKNKEILKACKDAFPEKISSISVQEEVEPIQEESVKTIRKKKGSENR